MKTVAAVTIVVLYACGMVAVCGGLYGAAVASPAGDPWFDRLAVASGGLLALVVASALADWLMLGAKPKAEVPGPEGRGC